MCVCAGVFEADLIKKAISKTEEGLRVSGPNPSRTQRCEHSVVGCIGIPTVFITSSVKFKQCICSNISWRAVLIH